MDPKGDPNQFSISIEFILEFSASVNDFKRNHQFTIIVFKALYLYLLDFQHVTSLLSMQQFGSVNGLVQYYLER